MGGVPLPIGKTRERSTERYPAQGPERDDCTFTNDMHHSGNNTTYASRRKAGTPTDDKWLLKWRSLRG